MVTRFHGLKLLSVLLYPFSARRAPNFSPKTNRVDRCKTRLVTGNSVDFFIKLLPIPRRCWSVLYEDAEHYKKLEPQRDRIKKINFFTFVIGHRCDRIVVIYCLNVGMIWIRSWPCFYGLCLYAVLSLSWWVPSFVLLNLFPACLDFNCSFDPCWALVNEFLLMNFSLPWLVRKLIIFIHDSKKESFFFCDNMTKFERK